MASLAIIQGERDVEMTNTAKFSFKDIAHFEVHGGFNFDVENSGVAIPAVQPLHMLVVVEGRWRNQGPVCRNIEFLLVGHRLVVLFEDARTGFDQAEV